MSRSASNETTVRRRIASCADVVSGHKVDTRGPHVGTLVGRCLESSESGSPTVARHHRTRRAVRNDAPVAHQNGAMAQLLDGREIVGDEHDGRCRGPEFIDPPVAALLEHFVAHGKHFVDEQNLRIDVRGHRESQPDVHARGVELDRASMNGPTPANATMLSNFAAISARRMPRIAPLRNTLSRPVSSGWNPDPTSMSAASRP